MRKTFRVAGHKFAVVMPDDATAWDTMQNYEPFLVEDSEDCIFVMEAMDDMPDTSKKQLVVSSGTIIGLPRIDLFELQDELLVEASPDYKSPISVYMFMSKDGTAAKFHVVEDESFSVNKVIMIMFARAVANRKTLLIHASVTMKEGKGYLFLGKSGTGKSTHSQLWINNIEGCSLLNDDNPALRVEDNGEVRVYGTPWSGKTPCYRNADALAGAIVDLHQAKVNRIKRQSLPEAYASLYVSYSGYRFLKELSQGYHNSCAEIVSKVPCYSLDCLPDADAAFLCYKTVSQ